MSDTTGWCTRAAAHCASTRWERCTRHLRAHTWYGHLLDLGHAVTGLLCIDGHFVVTSGSYYRPMPEQADLARCDA